MAQKIIRSIGSDGKEVLSNILDRYTGEQVTYKEISGITDQDVLDTEGILYIKQGLKYYKRDFNRVNVEIFGAKGDGITDNLPFIQRAIDALQGRGFVLYFPKKDNNYLINNSLNNLIIKDSISIESDGAFLQPTTTSTTRSIFVLDNAVNPDCSISIDGLNSEGIRRSRLISTTNGIFIDKKTIRSISLTNLRLGTHVILIDFNVTDSTYIENIVGGIGLSELDSYGFSITVSRDGTSIIGKSLRINNCYAYSGLEDIDIFPIKGANYENIEVTNCTAHCLAYITGRTGDGFDFDGIGKNALLENLTTINCGLELKIGEESLITNNITGNNFRIINSPGSGISLRSTGNFSNILVYNPVTTGLVCSGFNASDGSTIDDVYINLNNVQIINNGAGTSTVSRVTLGMSNTNIDGLSVYNQYNYNDIQNHSPLRISDNVKNINIRNFISKGCAQGISFPSGFVLSNLTFNNFYLKDLSSVALSFGDNCTFNNFELNNLTIENYTGPSSIIRFSESQVYNNVRLNNIPNVANIITTGAFTQHSLNIKLNGVIVNKLALVNNLPIHIPTMVLDSIVRDFTTNQLYLKVSTSSSPSVAYLKLISDRDTASISTKGLVNQTPAIANISTSTVTTIEEANTRIKVLEAKINDLLTDMRTAGMITP